MPRKARVVAAGYPHHITQRGLDRRDVFVSPGDRRLYLDLLFRYAARYGTSIWGYCLMTNHLDAVMVPEEADSLGKLFKCTNADYSRYFHLLHGGCGHFWQSRYFSCPMDDSYAWQALAYVERNPVRAGIVSSAEEYDWSSAKAHATGSDVSGQLDLGPWNQMYTAPRWREALRSSLREEALAMRIREASTLGFPLGEPGFVGELEVKLGQRIWRGPGGRRVGRRSTPIGEVPGHMVSVPSLGEIG